MQKNVIKAAILLVFVTTSFGYGMASQAWGLFPKNVIKEAYWEMYAKPEVYEPDSSRIQNNWKTIRTSLYKLSVDRINLPLRSHVEKTYGGIDELDSGVLIASNLGDLFYLDETRELHKLSVTIPFSRSKFDEVARSRNFNRHWFGVKDILVREESSSTFRIVVSSHHWVPEERCYTLQFETAVLSRKGTADFALREKWNEIYETHPCLPITRQDGNDFFPGLQAGGRIQAVCETKLLLTIGDHKRDGVNGDMQILTDSTTSHGKIIAVNPRTKEDSVVSMGHRNPQGLHIDMQGRIWSTEHGPEGGDELNLIEPGENYGWPHVIYGTKYGSYRWPPSDTIGAHPGYKRPVFAWVPSIAVSELTGIEGNLFDKWKGDLLISSLKKGTLYRTRIHNDRVIYVEPIELEPRLRDVIELKDGTIYIKTDNGALLVLRPTERSHA